MKYLVPKILAVTLVSIGSVASAQAENLPKYDPKLLVHVKTPSGKDVAVKGPEISYDDIGQSYYVWEIASHTSSPDGKFQEVHYLGGRPKYWDAVVYVVSPDGVVSELSNSTVKSVKWTEDSKYLLGFGYNTIRVWNMSDGYRQISFGNINSYHYQNNLLCVNSTSYRFDSDGQHNIDLIEVYSIPSLKKLTGGPYTSALGCNQ